MNDTHTRARRRQPTPSHRPVRSNKKRGGGGAAAIAVIIITKYNIKQLARRHTGKGPAHPPPCALPMKTPVQDAPTGLKTAPFQCQRRWEGLMRGWWKSLWQGEGAGRGAAWRDARLPPCQGSQSRPGDKAAAKEGPSGADLAARRGP